jgi:hypothetical protein
MRWISRQPAQLIGFLIFRTELVPGLLFEQFSNFLEFGGCKGREGGGAARIRHLFATISKLRYRLATMVNSAVGDLLIINGLEKDKR